MTEQHRNEGSASPDAKPVEKAELDKPASDGVVVPVPPAATGNDRRRARAAPTDEEAAETRRRGLMMVVPLVGVAMAIVGLVLTGMKDNAIYSKPVDELLAEKSKFAGRAVRVEGNLVHGTLVKRDQPCEYRFTITKNQADMPVRFAQCVVPDTFRDVPGMDVGVTVEGKMNADNSFEATSVLAKCPSKYEMKDRQKKGEQMPHVELGTTESSGLGANTP